MSIPKSFPMPIPSLTRVHILDEVEAPADDLTTFMSQFISLIVLTDFPDDPQPLLLKTANKLCTQPTAHPLQRVLWIPKAEMQAALKPTLEAAIAAGFPDKEVNFDNVAAISLAPASGKAAYVIYKVPFDKRKKLSTIEMQIAFNEAIMQMSKTPEP